MNIAKEGGRKKRRKSWSQKQIHFKFQTNHLTIKTNMFEILTLAIKEVETNKF